MAYCVQADIEEQLDEEILIQLTDDDEAGSVDADKVTRAIADADAEIDPYLAERGYTVPVSSVPALLRKLSVDIAIWNLYSRRAVDEPVRKGRYQAAVDLLCNIRDGLVPIGAESEPAGGGQAIQTSRVSSDRKLTIGTDDETGTLDDY